MNFPEGTTTRSSGTALINKPAIIFADEPSVILTHIRRKSASIIFKLRDEFGQTL
jgi:predicted ABC-type transport system involved in lysophospholipase L1 biosynthesis ATPase subunit